MGQLLTAEKFGPNSPEMETFDNEISGFDPDLHPIGVKQAEHANTAVCMIGWKTVFTSPM